MSKFLKGICYAAFPYGYDPSICNNTQIWFGSDIADKNIKPLWGNSFSPIDGPDKGKVFKGRDDIKKLAELGVNLIRLYDWDSRNDHIPFLDYCLDNNIQVLVPVSNYNLGAFGTPPNMTDSITALINSFSKDGIDYHPAIYGIIIGSELDLPNKMPENYLIQYTKEWAKIEETAYKNFREVYIGHPVSFAMYKGQYPCWQFWDELLPDLLNDTTKNLNKRIMLCPHTYNDAVYLYDNAQGSGKGWVDLTLEKYNIPILFCEIGASRLSSPTHLSIIADQISKSFEYANNNARLLGACHFQYCDKVWMEGTTEGSFGMVSNTSQFTDIVHYGAKDFTHFDCPLIENYLTIQVLKENPSFNILKKFFNIKS